MTHIIRDYECLPKKFYDLLYGQLLLHQVNVLLIFIYYAN